MDEYAGSKFRLGRGVDDPFEDHHKHQVAEETQHEDQLRNQHAKNAANVAEVARKKQEKEAYEGRVRTPVQLLQFVSTAPLLTHNRRGFTIALRYKCQAVRAYCCTVNLHVVEE